MKLSRKQFTLRWLFFGMACAAILSSWLRPKIINVRFGVLEFTTHTDPHTQETWPAANLQVVNKSPNDLWYYASSADYPDYKVRDNGGPILAGGSGSCVSKEWIRMPPGQSFEFTAILDDGVEKFSVGLNFHTSKRGEPVATSSDFWVVETP